MIYFISNRAVCACSLLYYLVLYNDMKVPPATSRLLQILNPSVMIIVRRPGAGRATRISSCIFRKYQVFKFCSTLYPSRVVFLLLSFSDCFQYENGISTFCIVERFYQFSILSSLVSLVRCWGSSLSVIRGQKSSLPPKKPNYSSNSESQWAGLLATSDQGPALLPGKINCSGFRSIINSTTS